MKFPFFKRKKRENIAAEQMTAPAQEMTAPIQEHTTPAQEETVAVQESLAEKLQRQLRHVYWEETVTRDALINFASQIQVTAESGDSWSIKSVTYKDDYTKSYLIFQAESAEALNGCLHRISDALEQVHGITLYPFYNEETNSSRCQLTVADSRVQMDFDYDGYILTLRAEECKDNGRVMNDFVVYLTMVLRETKPLP